MNYLGMAAVWLAAAFFMAWACEVDARVLGLIDSIEVVRLDARG
jgi:hypothetical protein